MSAKVWGQVRWGETPGGGVWKESPGCGGLGGRNGRQRLGGQDEPSVGLSGGLWAVVGVRGGVSAQTPKEVVPSHQLSFENCSCTCIFPPKDPKFCPVPQVQGTTKKPWKRDTLSARSKSTMASPPRGLPDRR